ncbi:MAG: 5-methyltetrahydropteroyltriglutamate--homocysteine S-methyltransferase [Proteobacteria bacterium]|nr:5-methyltetrahydropteroyltriglutamate--homocysteine S-methyltransferase [Pseudomonadota bacterium]
MSKSHILGFPRIGEHRQMKKAVEAYWQGQITLAQLEATGTEIQEYNWKLQADAGLDFVTVGDFSWYDHVLDTTTLLGAIPQRFKQLKNANNVALNTVFCMARGQAPGVPETTACEMTKWFNTNYHYIVPELTIDQQFHIATEYLFKSIDHAQKLGYRVKPVLLGPMSFLWLGKVKGNNFNKLTLLNRLLPVYQQILNRLESQKIALIQIDEPVLVLDLPDDWRNTFATVYQHLNFGDMKSLLATYFGSIEVENIQELPFSGVHVDFSNHPEELLAFAKQFPKEKFLSAGVVSGRNIWKCDLTKTLSLLTSAKEILKDRLWVASSCSLLHVPVNLEIEHHLDQELKSWLSFAKQKVEEVALLAKVLNQGANLFSNQLKENQEAIASRKNSSRIHHAAVKERISAITERMTIRNNPYEKRAAQQRKQLNLPLFPTTTIGSFPQTQEIRTLRRDYKAGKINSSQYTQKLREQIQFVIKKQEQLNLDVLVHGESERTDMVEYFGELLSSFAFTQNGWVQSYGSRCVKPPIIFGDVSRPKSMTVEWIQFAQSCTNRPVKGMLTGPVTILSWSFVRDDQPLADTAAQIALALRDEVQDLELAGIHVIQIDEPAFREALPLRKKDWQEYLDWAVACFRLASSGVQDQTQIHTHMCYSEFNDVIEAIAKLDADVITIENSRSEMELLKAFETFAYPNEIGPGVYDIHSPRVPSSQEIISHLENALRYVPAQRLWVNPDCGLKTRNWPEVEQALTNMVKGAKICREKYAKQPVTESR